MINRQRAQEEVTILDMGIRDKDRLDAAGNNVDDYIKIGRNALQELYEQRGLLKVVSESNISQRSVECLMQPTDWVFLLR